MATKTKKELLEENTSLRKQISWHMIKMNNIKIHVRETNGYIKRCKNQKRNDALFKEILRDTHPEIYKRVVEQLKEELGFDKDGRRKEKS